MEEGVRVGTVGRPSSHQNPESWWGHSRTEDQLTSVFVPTLILAMQGWTNQFPSFCPLIYKMYEYPHISPPLLVLGSVQISFVDQALWRRSLCNSMKLWAVLCVPTQDRWFRVKNSDKTWSTGGANGNPPQYSSLENPMNSMKRQKDRTPENEHPRSAV